MSGDLQADSSLGGGRDRRAGHGKACSPAADTIRQQAIQAALEHFQTSQDNHPLVLCTRFAPPVEGEYTDCFYVTVAGHACEVFRTLELPYPGCFDVECADDISPTFETSSEQEQIRLFVCAVALHAHGLLLGQAARVEALEVVRPPFDPPHAAPIRWIVTFTTSADPTSTFLVEVLETPAGIGREYRVGAPL